MLAAGCSSQEPDSPGSAKSPLPPDQAKVTFGGNDAGPITAIDCKTENGLTTIRMEGSLPTTVVFTEGESAAVQSVNIGEMGPNKPSLTYLEGLTSTPVVARHDAKNYTVNGKGMGISEADPTAPVDMEFDIIATCP